MICPMSWPAVHSSPAPTVSAALRSAFIESNCSRPDHGADAAETLIEVTDEGTMMLSLMRAHNLGAYGFGGGYEPGMSSETGFELGQRRSFEYALVPHDGDWRQAEAYRAGLEFNHPLLVRKTAIHAGSLPNHWGLIEISAPNVVLTALKQTADQSTTVRVYEASGQTTPGVKIALHARILSAYEANLLEDSGR